MSLNKIGQQGFGIGAFYGVPITLAVAETSTTTITGQSGIQTQQYYMASAIGTPATGALLSAVSVVSGGVTGTYAILNGGGHFYNDNTSFRIVNTTTSVNIVLIPA